VNVYGVDEVRINFGLIREVAMATESVTIEFPYVDLTDERTESFPINHLGTLACALVPQKEAEAAWTAVAPRVQKKQTVPHNRKGPVAPSAPKLELKHTSSGDECSSDEGGDLDDPYDDKLFEVDLAEYDQVWPSPSQCPSVPPSNVRFIHSALPGGGVCGVEG
jgi:hypothetical protein